MKKGRRKRRAKELILEHGKVNILVHKTASQKGKKKQPTHFVSGEEGVYAATMYHIRRQSKPKAFKGTEELCGEPHKLEIDTGATRTMLNEETYNKLCDKLELKSFKGRIKHIHRRENTSVG